MIIEIIKAIVILGTPLFPTVNKNLRTKESNLSDLVVAPVRTTSLQLTSS